MESILFSRLLTKSDDFVMDIHRASILGFDERVRDIIKSSETKSIIDKYNKKGWTPLMYAAYNAKLKVITLLLEEGAEIDLKNYEGHTALIMASKTGRSDVVSLLINNGAKVNEKDEKGWTALFHAVAFGYRSVVQLLIESGAVVDMMDKNERITPVILAKAANQKIILQDLFQLDGNNNAGCKSRDTVQSLALKYGFTNTIKVIDSFLPSERENYRQNLKGGDLAALLEDLDLAKYYQVFENHGIDLDAFWLLDEDKLKAMGIQCLGPRKKICLRISQYHQEHSSKKYSKECFVNYLTMEHIRNEPLIENLRERLYHEQNMRASSYQELCLSISNLEICNDNIEMAQYQSAIFLKTQKENNDQLKTMIHSIFQGMELNSNVKPKIDSIVQCLDNSINLVQLQHQYLLSIQQPNPYN